jgi:hypothetical protein
VHQKDVDSFRRAGLLRACGRCHACIRGAGYVAQQALAKGSVLADAARTDLVTVELRSAADARVQITFRDGIAERLLPLIAENAQAQGFTGLTLRD